MGELIHRPTGKRILGTSERVLGTAFIDEDSIVRDEEGRLAFEYGGETDIAWDSQAVVRDEQGRRLFVREDGEEVPEDEVAIIGEEGDKPVGDYMVFVNLRSPRADKPAMMTVCLDAPDMPTARERALLAAVEEIMAGAASWEWNGEPDPDFSLRNDVRPTMLFVSHAEWRPKGAAS